jgi:hypothetical protein
MPWGYDEIIQSEVDDLQAENAQANAQVEAARAAQDYGALRQALDRVYSVDMKFASLRARVANMQQQSAPRVDSSFVGTDLTRDEIAVAQRYGLSGPQMEAALAMTGDQSWSAEHKAEAYVNGLRRVRDWRASGGRDEVDLHNPGRR